MSATNLIEELDRQIREAEDEIALTAKVLQKFPGNEHREEGLRLRLSMIELRLTLAVGMLAIVEQLKANRSLTDL